jgi:hypothetical protein
MASQNFGRGSRRRQRAPTGPPRRNPRRGAAELGVWGDYQQLPDGRWMRGNGHIFGTPEPSMAPVLERAVSNNSQKTESYNSNNGMPNALNQAPPQVVALAESFQLDPQPLDRQQFALERFESVQFTERGEETELIIPEPAGLERFQSVTQSRVKFVLYTCSEEFMDSFKDGDGDFIREQIQLLYNSWQNVPIDYVLVDPTDHAQVRAIRSRMPRSVAHIGQGFSDGQMMDSLVAPDHFLLSVEADIPHSTHPMFGILCCSLEYCRRSSQDFLDVTGMPRFNFQTIPDDVYVYVHLFTFLSDRTTGDEFFTGTHMLEGLYLLLNHTDEDTIIYLEAIRIQATLDFYDRFGMERVGIDYYTLGWYFDPFQGCEVPDEIPFVLYSHNQIAVAAIQAAAARQRRQAGITAPIMDLINSSSHQTLLQNITPEDRAQLERTVSVFGHTRGRANAQAPYYPRR